MIKIFEDLKSLFDDIVRFATLDIGDKPNTTGIFFVLGVVKPLGTWKTWYVHELSIDLKECNYQEKGKAFLHLFSKAFSITFLRIEQGSFEEKPLKTKKLRYFKL